MFPNGLSTPLYYCSATAQQQRLKSKSIPLPIKINVFLKIVFALILLTVTRCKRLLTGHTNKLIQFVVVVFLFLFLLMILLLNCVNCLKSGFFHQLFKRQQFINTLQRFRIALPCRCVSVHCTYNLYGCLPESYWYFRFLLWGKKKKCWVFRPNVNFCVSLYFQHSFLLLRSTSILDAVTTQWIVVWWERAVYVDFPWPHQTICCYYCHPNEKILNCCVWITVTSLGTKSVCTTYFV